MRWFPLVGWALGAVGAGVAYGAARIGVAPGGPEALVVAGLIVAAWAVLSGMLHWDGLADAADGLGVNGDAARRLQVMRAGTTGAFGVTAVVLVALLQVSAVAALVGSEGRWAIIAAPVIARWSAGIALAWRRSARPDGLAARYAGSERGLGTAVMLILVAPIAPLAPDVRHALLAGACMLAALVIPTPFVRRLSGVTGDVLGATVLLAETLVLVGVALGQVGR